MKNEPNDVSQSSASIVSNSYIKVDDIENCFMMGNFSKCLHLSNRYIHHHYHDLPHKDRHNDDCTYDDDNNNDSFLEIPIKTGLCFKLTSQLRSHEDGKKQNGKFDSNENFGWNIKIIPNVSKMDRIFCIALQCIYELTQNQLNNTFQKLKMSNISSTHNYIETKTIQHTKLIEKKIKAHKNQVEKLLEPYLKLYRHNGGKNSMPLELSIVWIQFCHSLGAVDVAACISFELLHILLPKIAKDLSIVKKKTDSNAMQSEKKMYDHIMWIQSQCEDIFAILILKIYPLIDSNSLKDICSLLHVNKSSTKDETKLDISTETYLQLKNILIDTSNSTSKFTIESIAIITFHLQEIRKQYPNLTKFLIDMEQKLDVVATNDITKLGTEEDQKPSKNCEQQNLVGTDAQPNRQFESAQNHAQRQSNDERKIRASTIFVEKMYTHIIEPLWYDEKRWTNRGQLAAIGIASFLAWKRRRRFFASTRNAGSVVISPVRELFDALTSSK